jgi:hypothetical protein
VRVKRAEPIRGEDRDTRRVTVNELLAQLDRSITTRRRKRIRAEETELYDEAGMPA